MREQFITITHTNAAYKSDIPSTVLGASISSMDKELLYEGLPSKLIKGSKGNNPICFKLFPTDNGLSAVLQMSSPFFPEKIGDITLSNQDISKLQSSEFIGPYLINNSPVLFGFDYELNTVRTYTMQELALPENINDVPFNSTELNDLANGLTISKAIKSGSDIYVCDIQSKTESGITGILLSNMKIDNNASVIDSTDIPQLNYQDSLFLKSIIETTADELNNEVQDASSVESTQPVIDHSDETSDTPEEPIEESSPDEVMSIDDDVLEVPDVDETIPTENVDEAPSDVIDVVDDAPGTTTLSTIDKDLVDFNGQLIPSWHLDILKQHNLDDNIELINALSSESSFIQYINANPNPPEELNVVISKLARKYYNKNKQLLAIQNQNNEVIEFYAEKNTFFANLRTKLSE